MNSDIIKGNWKQIKGKIQQSWGELTDDELNKIEGGQLELVGVLQEKYGYSKDEAHKKIDKFLKDNQIN